MQLIAPTTGPLPAPAPPGPQLRFYHNGRSSRPVCELVHMQSDANYTWLFWLNGQRMLMPRTMKYFEAQLPADDFIRLHRNYSVNVRHIVAVHRPSRVGVEVKLSNGICLLVARRRWVQIRNRLYQLGIILG